MEILSETIKDGILSIKTSKNLFEITTNEISELGKKHKAYWNGGIYENKITTLKFKIK